MQRIPPVFVVIRKTLDWSDEAAVEAGLRADLRPKVATWDATFRMPYREFRQRVKEIARENLARVEGVVVAPIEEVPPGALMMPVDDDDWYAPDVATRLREGYDPAAKGWSWPSFTLEARRVHGRGRWPFRLLR